jgi:hypothetical protein
MENVSGIEFFSEKFKMCSKAQSRIMIINAAQRILVKEDYKVFVRIVYDYLSRCEPEKFKELNDYIRG